MEKRFLFLYPKKQIYISGLNEVDLDIFATMGNCSTIIVSERLVEACEKEGITNILDKLVRVYDDSEYKDENK